MFAVKCGVYVCVRARNSQADRMRKKSRMKEREEKPNGRKDKITAVDKAVAEPGFTV